MSCEIFTALKLSGWDDARQPWQWELPAVQRLKLSPARDNCTFRGTRVVRAQTRLRKALRNSSSIGVGSSTVSSPGRRNSGCHCTPNT